MRLGISLVFSFADYLKEMSETKIENYFSRLCNKGVQQTSSLSWWKYILVWDLLQFTIGGQSPRRLGWIESCAEEEQSPDICCCWGLIIMFWKTKIFIETHIFCLHTSYFKLKALIAWDVKIIDSLYRRKRMKKWVFTIITWKNMEGLSIKNIALWDCSYNIYGIELSLTAVKG